MRKYFFYIITFLLISVCLKGQSIKPLQDYLDEASLEVSLRRFNSAITIYTKALTQYPQEIKLYTARAMASALNANYDNAQKDIFKALSMDINNVEAYYVRGWICVYLKQYDKALIDFNTALDLNPNYKPAKAGKINTLMLLGEISKALEYADACIKEDPAYGDYFFYKGKVMSMRQKYQDAINLFNLALDISINVDRYEIYLNRGDAKQNINLFSSAKDDFNKAISIDSSHASAFHGRGVTLYRLGYYKEALADFDKAISIIEQNPDRYDKPSEAYYNRGMTYFRLEEFGKACRNFHISCSLQNTNACKMIVLNCGNKATP